jgi:hypothetical protein
MASILSEYSGRALGCKLHVAFNPEFLREGNAIKDLAHVSLACTSDVPQHMRWIKAGVTRLVLIMAS